jgi:antitoxin component YwqK of YwqJK toxin-antitoxin module
MSAFKILIISLFVGLHISAGLTDEDNTMYFNERMEQVKNKNKASYTGKLESKDADGYLFKIYFITGEVKMQGYYTDDAMNQANGLFTYYYQNGQMESTGYYRNGSKYGIWQRYDPNGTAKAEKIYAMEPILQALRDEEN